MFIATSTSTSKAIINDRPTSSSAGVVESPMTAKVIASRAPAMSNTTRVPKREIAPPALALPTRPNTPAIDSSAPTPAIDIPTRSRISGIRGMNEAKIAPFAKNCTATARSARWSVRLKVPGTE